MLKVMVLLMKYWCSEHAVRTLNVELDGIKGVTHRYWYYLGRKASVVEERQIVNKKESLRFCGGDHTSLEDTR
jgi:hypothetical protein